MSSGNQIIVGLGNVLLQDDGIGVWLVRELLNQKKIEYIQVHEIGISSFSLFYLVPPDGARILFIDALTVGKPPGSIHCFTSTYPLIPFNNEKRPISLHQFRLEEVLYLLKRQNENLIWKMFGVEPAIIDYGHGLSKCLQIQFPAILDALKAEIRHFFL